MKSAGIIGSFGPSTTARFFEELLINVQKRNKKFRPKILLSSTPISIIEESDLIKKRKRPIGIKNCLIKAAKELENNGVDFLVLPCNTLHMFIEDIKDAVNIPVLDILEETEKVIKNMNIGLLSTSATVEFGLFNKLKIIKLNNLSQRKLDLVIDSLVRGDKLPNNVLNFFISELKNNGASSILLACTDLQLVEIPDKTVQIFDTFNILLNKTVEKIVDE